MFNRTRPLAAMLAAFLFLGAALRAWDIEGHRTVNQLALASLPRDFPDFVRTPANAARIAYLANLPDRWRNADPFLKQNGGSWTDHYFDLEQLDWAGLDVHALPSLRIDFAVQFAAARAAHLDKFPAIDPAKNIDHTQEWMGFAPWAIAECYHRLRSAFGALKAFEDLGGTPEEIANAQADVVQAMGVMGHYIGDCSQPLHTTMHHNGWVGTNPQGYTTWPGFHAWVDGKEGGFFAKANLTAADVLPRAKTVEPFTLGTPADGRDPFFIVAVDYILAQHALVEPLYKLEKAGLLANGDRPVAPEGRAFIEGQLLKGGEMLARTWTTAWKTAPVDTYLRTYLGKRQAAAAGTGAKSAPKKAAP